MILKEIWKSVKGYENYEVSDLGNVRTLKYIGKTGKVRLLRPGLCKNGYLQVALSKDGKPKTFYVHGLVMTAFRGDIPKGMVVNHLNENKLDNRLENLEIVTQKENVNHGQAQERKAKAKSKQLDLMEADWPYRELTFENSLKASEFFNYKAKETVGIFISRARKRGENFINLRKTKYFFAQQQ